ncbi:hypothetical protein Q0F99_18040 [Rathayibacter oskolensis]|nr:hypothetical protein [Rathayibacter oskolensis]WKK71321.1 hypothetical protein Q0F99_18040 [Rathayibacter oskolensis]
MLSGAVGRLRWLASFAGVASAGVVLTVSGGVVGAALGLASSRIPTGR